MNEQADRVKGCARKMVVNKQAAMFVCRRRVNRLLELWLLSFFGIDFQTRLCGTPRDLGNESFNDSVVMKSDLTTRQNMNIYKRGYDNVSVT